MIADSVEDRLKPPDETYEQYVARRERELGKEFPQLQANGHDDKSPEWTR
jgi:hypothetical protein